jgi:NAD(P) transhydrogenase
VSSTYDLAVIGSGPAGQKAAIQAAKLGKRVTVIERGHTVGGVCVNTGTIPSKTLREAVLYLTGLSHRFAYGQSYRLKDELTMNDLLFRARVVMDVIRDQLRRNRVELIEGTARFVEPHVLAVDTPDDVERRLDAPVVVIAVGTSPTHPPGWSSTDGWFSIRTAFSTWRGSPARSSSSVPA